MNRSLMNPLRLFLGTALAVSVLQVETVANNWPGWRGAGANGSLTSGSFPTKWSASAPEWKVALPGKGSSTPIVWKERIYLTAPSEGRDAVLAFDMAGKQQWLTVVGTESPAKHRTLGSSCNASPVTDGDAVYVYFKSGNLAALGLDGKLRWKINITERFGQEKLFWDQGTSPVLAGPNLILTRMHGGESWIAAFDKQTGELRWQEARNYTTPAENDNGYSTPLVFDHEGKTALLVWGADHLTAHDASNGKQLWSAGGFNPDATGYWPAISSPIIHRDVAVVPVGRDDRPGQSRVHGIRLGGKGDVSATHRVWKREDIGVFVSALAEHAGRVYLLRHRGEVVCLDPASGKTLWADGFPKDRASYYSSPVVANGILYAAREDGVVFAARVGERFELLSENPMGERIIASPVPASNRLLLRGDVHLFCIKANASE